MAPDWLKVPAAERAASASGQGHAPRRARARAGADAGTRLVVFVPGSRLADCLCSSPAGCTETLARLGAVPEGLARSAFAPLGGGVEVIDAGMLVPTLSGYRPVSGGSLPSRRDGRRPPMDSHPLDVCLSIGRHAAERAKLAGCRSVHAAGLTDACPFAEPIQPWHGHARMSAEGGRCRPLRGSTAPGVSERELLAVYELLRARASFQLAALVGLLLASSQMGIAACAWGSGGREAAAITLRLSPGARAWIRVAEARSDGSQEGHDGRREAVDADPAYRSLKDSASVLSESMAASE